MATDSEIGRVVAVDTAQVSIELNRDLKGMSRSTYEGPQEVGRINSYVIIPVGARRLVAMVTRVVLVEDAEMKADRTMVALPAARRLMKATLVGTIDGDSFRQGVSLFPILDNPVHLAGRADLDAIFGPIEQSASAAPDPDRPGYCIPIGESAVVQGRPVRIDPDAFFGKHAAILGSTGSGKSCTIASLLQSIREQPGVKRTTCVILDTNGEYRSAFQREHGENHLGDVGPGRCLYIPSDPAKHGERLAIPYWFMDSEDFVRLFQASRGVQRPLLLEALRVARNAATTTSGVGVLREELVHEFNRIWSLSGSEGNTSRDVRDLAAGLKARIGESDLASAWAEAPGTFGIDKTSADNAMQVVVARAEKHMGRDNRSGELVYPQPIPADARKAIRDAIEPIYEKLTGTHLGEADATVARSADAPSHFDKLAFRARHVEQVLRREESGGPRARDYAGTMLLRIDRLLADRRFDFLFGSVGEAVPAPAHALAAFLRDTLGIGRSNAASLSNESEVPKARFPFYDRQRAGTGAVDVVILDLSLLAAEVLENVTALIGRLILDFLQRLDGKARGSLPVVLVLEEAQNYIQQPRFADEESIARVVFERIAREGRKYGLSLVVASQRPSELSRTVLSQCSSFIVHRLQNPEDLRYFKEIVPAIYGPMLEQIPALAPQTALVLGECVAAPALVKIREARPVPRSRDPRFYAYWTSEDPPSIDVEAIASAWEASGIDVDANNAAGVSEEGGQLSRLGKRCP